MEMVEEVEISNVVDKAIIRSFKYAEKGILPAGGIKKLVKKMFVIDESDTNIQKKVEKLFDNGILIDSKPSRPKKSKNRDYKVNPNIEIKLTGPMLLLRESSVEISEKSRRKHTEDIKRLIQNWIEYFPHPSTKYPTDEHVLGILNGPNERRSIAEDSSDLACNFYLHPLFSDMTNHLPPISDVCEKFENYKNNLKILDNLKMELYDLIKAELKSYCDIPEIKSFNRSHLGDYCEPYPIEVPIYNELFILQSPQKFMGGDKEDPRFLIVWENETYDYEDTIYNNRDRILFVFPSIHRDSNGNISVGDSVYYALNCTSGIENHIETYDYLCKVKDNFLNGDIWDNSKLVDLAKNISTKAEELKQMEFEIIEELRRILHYAIFPGDCEYLCV